MSKVRILYFALILTVNLFLNVKYIKADFPSIQTCPNGVKTEPTTLNSRLDTAKFIIPLGSFYDSSVSKWTVAFDCGATQQTGATSAWNLTLQSVVADIPRNKNPGAGCEFYPGTHYIAVKGNDILRCKAQYAVLDSNGECKLSLSVSNSVAINPPDGIIPSSKVEVSGKNLTEGSRFYLYIDNDQLAIINSAGNAFLDTPEFPKPGFTYLLPDTFKIPNDKLTPGTHQVFIKEYNLFTLPFQSQYGPPLCPIAFTVGTPDAPGSVSTGTFATVCTGANCTKGGGDLCDDTRGPAIKTAIGCIHTNPSELVKDLMTFLIDIGGGLAFLMMLFGVFQMLTSAGNPETLNAGRERLTSAVIGLLFVIFAVLLLQIIGVDILKIPGFDR